MICKGGREKLKTVLLVREQKLIEGNGSGLPNAQTALMDLSCSDSQLAVVSQWLSASDFHFQSDSREKGSPRHLLAVDNPYQVST